MTLRIDSLHVPLAASARHEAPMLAFRGAGQRLLAAGGLRAAADAFRDGAWVAALAGPTRQAEEPCIWTDVLTRPQRQPEPRRVQPKAVAKS